MDLFTGVWEQAARHALPVAIAAVVCLTTSLVVLRRRWASGLPLPPAVPTSSWANAKVMGGSDVYFTILRWSEAYGSIFRMPVPFSHLYFVCDPKAAVRILLHETAEKPKLYDAFDFGNGPNMFTKKTFSAGPHGWAWARKGVAPAFSPTAITKKIPTLQSTLDRFFAVLRSHSDSGEPLDMADLFTRLTMDFIGISAFDYDLKTLEAKGGTDESEGLMFVQELDILLQEARMGIIPFRRFMFWNSKVRRAKLAAQRIRDLALRILAHYRSAHTQEEIQTSSSILAHILRNPGYPSDLARASDVIVFLVAGYDTTAYTLAWTLWELARHPEVTRRVQRELDTVLPDRDSLPASSQLSQLPYLGVCIKESMRLWPVAAMGSVRELKVDFEANGVAIPRGAPIFVPFYAVFRQPWIERPHDFWPERWEDGSPQLPQLQEMNTPFSNGKRNCVGQTLALLELRMVLATTLRQFDFSVVVDAEPEYNFTLKPRNMRLRVQARTRG